MTLFKKRIERVLNVNTLYPKLITPSFILKNSILFPFHYLVKNNGSAPPILGMDLKLTRTCNGKCEFCLTETNNCFNKNEITTKNITDFIYSFKKQKIAFFITGGEPFLRKDLNKIIKAIRLQGSYSGIVSNGILITKKRADDIIQAGIDTVLISVHGLEKSHNSILKIKNAYQKSLKSISYFKRKNGPYLMINAVLNKHLLNEYKEFIDTAIVSGVDWLRFSIPSFIYPNEYLADKKATKKIFGKSIKNVQCVTNENPLGQNSIPKLLALKKYISKIKSLKISFYPNLTTKEIKDRNKIPFTTKRKCIIPFTSTFISEEGEVYPCQFYCQSMGNVNTTNFNIIWNSAKYKKFRKVIKKKLLPGCARCIKPI